jgi:type III secretion system PrgH/EprH family protein
VTAASTSSIQPCVLRIFNGPLQGCEFSLTGRRSLFIVAPVELLESGGLAVGFPEDAIFVPLDQQGCNFEVLMEAGQQDGVTLRLLDDSGHTRQCPFQRIEQVGGLKIELRSVEQSWAPELFKGQVAATAILPTPGLKPAAAAKWAVAAAAFALMLISLGVWSLPQPSAQADIQALINGASADTQVVRGRDNTVYVFVSTERDAGWSRQVLMRNPLVAGKVLVMDQERRRLERVLNEHDPQLAWNALDLQEPLVPRLYLSAQRTALTPASQSALLAALLAAAPYARDVAVHLQDDQLQSRQAEQGLQRLSLPFSRTEHNDSVTFVVAGNLQDAELASVRQYVNGFYRQWGDRHVNFAVELKDDALKGKSFQTGPQGYIKTTSSSWHFPAQP